MVKTSPSTTWPAGEHPITHTVL